MLFLFFGLLFLKMIEQKRKKRSIVYTLSLKQVDLSTFLDVCNGKL